MSYKKGVITQMAENAIQRLSEYYSYKFDAYKVLSYMNNKSCFKALPDQLRETMIKAGVCKEDDPIETFVDILYSRLCDLYKSMNWILPDKFKEAIKGWFDSPSILLSFNNNREDLEIIMDSVIGADSPEDAVNNLKGIVREDINAAMFRREPKSLRYRYNDKHICAVDICFALELDIVLATDFMNKLGFAGFNVRNVREAVFMYCIVNGRSRKDAQDILDKFEQMKATQEVTVDKQITSHSGNTTYMLQNGIWDSWDNEDDFINEYLIPNRLKFIGYSYNAFREYYYWKNMAFLCVIIDIIKKEFHYVDKLQDENEVESNKEFGETAKNYIPYTLAVRSALGKHSDKDSLLYSENLSYNRDHNEKSIMVKIQKRAIDTYDLGFHMELSVFLQDIIKMEGLLKHVFISLKSPDKRLRPYQSYVGKSKNHPNEVFRKTVMDRFPSDDSFSKFEKNPVILFDGAATRKAIVLLYYIAYAYELSTSMTEDDYSSLCFKEMGFKEFGEGLNGVLEKCALPSLYAANQFDFLVLWSIRSIELVSIGHYLDNPAQSFNEVLAAYFGSVFFEDESDDEIDE